MGTKENTTKLPLTDTVAALIKSLAEADGATLAAGARVKLRSVARAHLLDQAVADDGSADLLVASFVFLRMNLMLDVSSPQHLLVLFESEMRR